MSHSLNDLDMFRCRVCGSIGQTPQACGVCGGAVREISQDPSGQSTVSRQLLRPFWTGTKIAAMMIVVLFAVSTVGAGLYLSARPAHPLRPTRPRTVIASHIHSRKARTVLFQKGRCRYRRSGDIISDGYVVILRVRMPQTRSTV